MDTLNFSFMDDHSNENISISTDVIANSENQIINDTDKMISINQTFDGIEMISI